MSINIVRFNKETAPTGHNGSILAGAVLPEGMEAPFGHAWGYLEGESMMEGHEHGTEEVYLVFAGEGYVHIGGERAAVKAGDVVRVPPGEYHTMSCEVGKSLLWAAFWWR
ncbi:MAG: cupin domain-containing protein [Oscillospiraceae bacterium]|jgi:mannose-6-phosphate isomerase-like protein (cupin superfamily)|nr:cupin domain-containing protein [Oscillospiraceae bacterium]